MSDLDAVSSRLEAICPNRGEQKDEELKADLPQGKGYGEKGQHVSPKNRWACCRRNFVVVVLLLAMAILTLALGVVAVLLTDAIRKPQATTQLQKTSSDISELSLHNQTPEPDLPDAMSSQGCGGSAMKNSFPDLDYALLGYNILKGFPLSVGHDPGFTFPIFQADYSHGGQTADCRYSVPKGLMVIPDVSCVTSFSSTTVNTQFELQKSLSVSAKVEAGGWGVSFSASTGYQQASSTVSSGKWVVIYSTASCNYYYCKLQKGRSPPFHTVFTDWLEKLNTSVSSNSQRDKSVFWDFFEYFGTHFLTEVTFGASFTYEHKLSSSSYSSMQSSGINVAVAAGYSGLFTAGGEFKLDSSQKEKASRFKESAQTRTVTIGAAPPANGDATAWASTVKESPVPTKYSLSSIEDLFTEDFMGNLNIRYEEIGSKIKSYKAEYCAFLREKGLVDNCQKLVEGLILPDTELIGNPEVESLSRSSCIEACLQKLTCVAIDFCSKCTTTDHNYHTCHMYDETKPIHAKKTTKMESTLILPKVKRQFVLDKTHVIGRVRSSNKTNHVKDCLRFCLEDAHCTAFTYCECPGENNCKLYREDGMIRLEEKQGTKTYFTSRLITSVDDIYPTSRPTKSVSGIYPTSTKPVP